MKTTSRTYLIVVIALLMLFSCKTPKEPRYVDYQPYFNQLQKEYVITPSLEGVKLDTVVQVLSNLREEIYTFKDTITVDQEFNYYEGELLIDINLINEKPLLFDTLMVVKGFLMRDSLVDLLFPVVSDSIRAELLSLTDSITKRQATNPQTINPTIPTTTKQSVQPGNSSTQTISNVKKKYYSREDILADTKRDLFDADALITKIFATSGWKIGDSIPYYKGFSNSVPDSSVLFTTEMVYVPINDTASEVKQYPIEKLSKEIVEKKSVSDRSIFTEQVNFIHFFKDEEDAFMDMVRVQGGSFKIGSNEFDEDERPEYGLSVSNYLMGKYEVTNKIFCTLLNLLKCDSLGRVNHTKFIDWKSRYSKIYWETKTGRFKVREGFKDYPVVNVTWAAANKVCMEMGGRLPSEAEWEYAAKGGVYAIRYYTNQSKSDYAYEYRFAGSNTMSDVGWFVDNSDGYCVEVGQRAPNRLGLYDMSGNVWEWCWDNYSSEFYKHNSDSSDPVCLTSNGVRINRGGSWSSDAIYCRITNRNFSPEFECNPYLGLRLMREWRR
jgi:formylglycine-generating enzyme required for sulfatase activity